MSDFSPGGLFPVIPTGFGAYIPGNIAGLFPVIPSGLGAWVPIGEGDNEFVIKCTDQMGNITERKILIHRKLPKVYEVGSRMSVLVLPFTAEGIRNTQTLTHDIESNLLKRLIESKRFSIKNCRIRGNRMIRMSIWH